MSKRKTLLLNQIIQEYLKHKEPIGSESLKVSFGMKISSATIRNHFRALVEEGRLSQPHISSGRIPTNTALKGYWRANIDTSDIFELQNSNILKEASKDLGIFIMTKSSRNQKLQEVINHQNKFLIASFGENELVLKYSSTLERFTNELIGLDTKDIRQIAYQVCAKELLQKLEHIDKDKFDLYGIEELAEILKTNQRLFFEITSGRIYDKLNNGIVFDEVLPDGYLAILQDICIDSKELKMLCIGKLDRNYSDLYKILKKEGR